MTPEAWMDRYAVESEETDSYDDYDVDLYLVCLECRQKALAGKNLLRVGKVLVPELGCLGPAVATPRLGLKVITELVLRHEEAAHAP